jgi:hypothetical protein
MVLDDTGDILVCSVTLHSAVVLRRLNEGRSTDMVLDGRMTKETGDCMALVLAVVSMTGP